MKSILLLLSLIFLSCKEKQEVSKISKKSIHPKIFEMVECWLSDTAYPIVTEVNIDAIEVNRNQFSFAEIKEENGWVYYPNKEGGYLRYKIILNNGDNYKILFQDNGGGTLTTQSEIEFNIISSSIIVNGKTQNIRALKILSIKNALQ